MTARRGRGRGGRGLPAAAVLVVAMAAAVGAGRATAEDTPTAAPAEGPVAVIERLHAGLLKVLEQAKRLDYRARYERIGPAIDAAYDLPFMAEKVIGRQWKDLDDGARARWIQTFGRLTKATYAARFDDYGGQRFETLGEERGAYDTVMVRSRVVDPAAENVDLTYRLRNGAAGWKIVDVYLKGTVSELALRRSEYTAILGRGGMAGLFKEVDETIARLAEGTAVTP